MFVRHWLMNCMSIEITIVRNMAWRRQWTERQMLKRKWTKYFNKLRHKKVLLFSQHLLHLLRVNTTRRVIFAGDSILLIN